MTNFLLACPRQTPCTIRTMLRTHLLIDIIYIHSLLQNVCRTMAIGLWSLQNTICLKSFDDIPQPINQCNECQALELMNV